MFLRFVAANLTAIGSFTFCESSSSFDSFKIAAKEKANVAIFNTKTHEDLHRALSHQTSTLQSNGFKGSNGPHSRLIQGPKGIGKSTVLKTFLDTRESEVLTMYLSYDEMFMSDSPLSEKSVLLLVEEKLNGSGLIVNRATNNNLGECIAATLEKHNKHLFIIIDEVDQLYRVSHVQDAYKVAMTTLGDLAWLGNQKSGRFAIFLCGSSASCPLLVTCHANKEEFPLQIGAPNLNGQRFKTLRLTVPVFTHIADLQGLLDEMGHGDDTSTARLVAFQVGFVARNIASLAHMLAGDEKAFLRFSANKHESGLRSEQSLSRQLYEELMDKFLEKNQLARRMISDPVTGHLLPHLVETVEWESVFLPLTYEDMTTCWARVCVTQNLPHCTNLDMLQQLIFGLCDQGKLSFVDVHRSLPMYLYPVCGAQVFLHRTDMSVAQEFAATIDIILKKRLAGLLGKVENALAAKVIG